MPGLGFQKKRIYKNPEKVPTSLGYLLERGGKGKVDKAISKLLLQKGISPHLQPTTSTGPGKDLAP